MNKFVRALLFAPIIFFLSLLSYDANKFDSVYKSLFLSNKMSELSIDKLIVGLSPVISFSIFFSTYISVEYSINSIYCLIRYKKIEEPLIKKSVILFTYSYIYSFVLVLSYNFAVFFKYGNVVYTNWFDYVILISALAYSDFAVSIIFNYVNIIFGQSIGVIINIIIISSYLFEFYLSNQKILKLLPFNPMSIPVKLIYGINDRCGNIISLVTTLIIYFLGIYAVKKIDVGLKK